jgi:uroporphyrinogen III methyltransferase/synthase
VDFFFDYLKEQGYDIRNIPAKFSVVGKAASKALKDRGILPEKVAEEFYAEGLFKVVKPILNTKEKVLIPCSTLSRDYLSEEISRLGLEVDKVSIYETVIGEVRNPKAFDETDIVLFTSPSTVKNMIAIIGVENIRKKTCIAIGPSTFDTLKLNNIEAVLCKEYSENGLIEEIKKLWSDKNDKAN